MEDPIAHSTPMDMEIPLSQPAPKPKAASSDPDYIKEFDYLQKMKEEVLKDKIIEEMESTKWKRTSPQ